MVERGRRGGAASMGPRAISEGNALPAGSLRFVPGRGGGKAEKGTLYRTLEPHDGGQRPRCERARRRDRQGIGEALVRFWKGGSGGKKLQPLPVELDLWLVNAFQRLPTSAHTQQTGMAPGGSVVFRYARAEDAIEQRRRDMAQSGVAEAANNPAGAISAASADATAWVAIHPPS